jgi:hypothetical protein
MIRSAVLLGVIVASAPVARGEAPSFRVDVMATLSKAGCNLGVCHGNQNGKGGFRLSLRGQDPQADYLSLTRELGGRRTNPQSPETSLILQKPTLQVAHEGGRRFDVGSPEYGVLAEWMRAGCPDDTTVQATLPVLRVDPADFVLTEPADRFSIRALAGSKDVTTWAVYEASDPRVSIDHDGQVTFNGLGEATVIVRYLEQQQTVRVARIPDRPDYAWTGPEPANLIDEYVFARLKQLRADPAGECSDSVFLRRVSLDLLGILPTAEEARSFVSDSRADKRARLVDACLERPEFAESWAQKWGDLLRIEERTLDRKGVETFHGWIRQSLAANKPLDQFVRELLSARGSTYEVPPANYYRAMRDPVTRGESAAQVFLGIRLQCARCHNHPFAPWTQADYYGWTNVFARIDYTILENRRRDRNDSHEFDGEQIVRVTQSGGVPDPRTGEPVAPRFLGADSPLKNNADRLAAVAEWVTRPDNPYFARVQVNRVWHQLFGRGIVDPIDDFRPTNPPSHPQLLDALAADFIQNGYDLRNLLRTIMASRTYQRASVGDEPHGVFAANRPRRLAAEQMLDSLSQFAGVPQAFNGYPEGLRAGQLPGIQAVRPRDEPPSGGDRFLKLFGKPPRLQSCECERSNESSLSQVLLLTGGISPALFGRDDSRMAALASSGKPLEEIVDDLFWTALSRPPTTAELQTTAAHLQRAPDLRAALEDVAWALANSREFLFRL